MSAFFILPGATAGDAREELYIGGDGHGARRVSADQFLRLEKQVAALRARNDELYTAALDALSVINTLQRRLSDKGLLGLPEDLNGFYNGTGTDGINVQVCRRLLALQRPHPLPMDGAGAQQEGEG